MYLTKNYLIYIRALNPFRRWFWVFDIRGGFKSGTTRIGPIGIIKINL